MYDRLIYQKNEFEQWRVTVNEFRDVEYFHLRKYILDFDDTWVPTKDGATFPLDLQNIQELFIAMLEILSLGESKQAIKEHFGALLEEIYQ